jgi:phosphonate transport system permease protein
MTQDTIWFFVGRAAAGRRYRRPDACRRAGPISANCGPLWDTINIATLGTLGGVIMAVPVAFLAARNTTPSALFLRPIALFIIVASRSINSLIWALLLVAIIGPGLLGRDRGHRLRSIGFIGKLLYEAIEETDETQIEAIRPPAPAGQVLAYGIVPQIMPAFWGITVFRWDINIREAPFWGWWAPAASG